MNKSYVYTSLIIYRSSIMYVTHFLSPILSLQRLFFVELPAAASPSTWSHGEHYLPDMMAREMIGNALNPKKNLWILQNQDSDDWSHGMELCFSPSRWTKLLGALQKCGMPWFFRPWTHEPTHGSSEIRKLNKANVFKARMWIDFQIVIKIELWNSSWEVWEMLILEWVGGGLRMACGVWSWLAVDSLVDHFSMQYGSKMIQVGPADLLWVQCWGPKSRWLDLKDLKGNLPELHIAQQKYFKCLSIPISCYGLY